MRAGGFRRVFTENDRPVWVDLPENPLPPREDRPTVVPVFLPHAGCPHRCIFCNQNAITGQHDRGFPPDLDEIVSRFLQRKPSRPERVELAFYGGNFLGQSAGRIDDLLTAAADLVRRGWIGSVRFSTRPETIDDQRLAWIAGSPVATVELGGQSMDETVLAASRRGHTAGDTVSAVRRLRRASLRVGIQTMIGLPGQDPRSALRSGGAFARLKPDFVRIYPCLVLAGSPLAQAWRQGAYRALSLEGAVTIACRLWRLYARRGIPVIRMGLQDAPELAPGRSLLAGPCHPAFGHLVLSALCLQALARVLKRVPADGRKITVLAHPRQTSRVRGHRNANIVALRQRFAVTEVEVAAVADLPTRRLGLIVH